MDNEASSSTNFQEDINFATILRVGSEALESCEEKIQTWKKQHAEYANLKESLEKLPQEISHDVMVPFGNCAFMQGKMIHTNEILVLLGDNWFVSRSAFQAIEIAIRRLEYVENELKKLEEEKEFYTQKLKFVNDYENNEGLVEIREPFNDDEEQSSPAKETFSKNNFDDKTSANEPETNSEIKNEAPSGVSAEEYAKLMARLDEFEKFEQLEDEQAMNENDAANENSSEKLDEDKISIENMQINDEQIDITANKFCDDSIKIIDLYGIDDDSASSSSKEINETMKFVVDEVEKLVKKTSNESKMKFNEYSSSTDRKYMKKVTWDETSFENLADCADTPTEESTPTVIKIEEPETYSLPPMKSILKNRRESSPVDHNLIREMEERRTINVLPGSVEAFTGIVCEKSLSMNVAEVSSKPQQVALQPFNRRASKFKVQRASIQ